MCTIFFIVVTLYIQRCVDYYSFIHFWCHHTLLGHIYDVTTFQTILMSHVALCHREVHCLLLVITNHLKLWHNIYADDRYLMSSSGSLHMGRNSMLHRFTSPPPLNTYHRANRCTSGLAWVLGNQSESLSLT